MVKIIVDMLIQKFPFCFGSPWRAGPENKAKASFHYKPLRTSLVVLAWISIQGCSAPVSNAVPDFGATRVKVNTASARSASLSAKSSAIEIKNSEQEISQLSSQIETLRDTVQTSRLRLVR